jgi:hypothetical protein
MSSFFVKNMHMHGGGGLGLALHAALHATD